MVLVVKNPSANKRRGFNLWVRKFPWKRAWQPTPVFLPGGSHGQRSLPSGSSWGHKQFDMSETYMIFPLKLWDVETYLFVANEGDIRDVGSIPGSGRSPGGGHGNLLQYSCLENSMDRGDWQATVRRVAQSWTRLK